MDILSLIAKFWVEALMAGILSAICFLCRHVWKQLKRDFFDVVKSNQEEIKTLTKSMDEKFDNINNRIETLYDQSVKSDLSIIRDVLLRKLRHGLQSECISMADLETSAALMAQYEQLGGNGEIHKLYKRYEKIHICPEHEHFVPHECDGCERHD